MKCFPEVPPFHSAKARRALATGPVKCAVLPLPVDDGDWRLRHKTTDRGFYNEAFKLAERACTEKRIDDADVSEGHEQHPTAEDREIVALSEDLKVRTHITLYLSNFPNTSSSAH